MTMAFILEILFGCVEASCVIIARLTVIGDELHQGWCFTNLVAWSLCTITRQGPHRAATTFAVVVFYGAVGRA